MFKYKDLLNHNNWIIFKFTQVRFLTDTPVISLSEVRRFMAECMQKIGTPIPQSEALASVLSEADYRGTFSHGMNRLEMYMEDIIQKVCDPCAEPVIITERQGTALVDGRNGIGAYVSRYCMDLAICKAKKAGIGLVTCRGSNHFGIGAMYPLQAVREGLIGMSFTNTSPVMSPTRSNQSALGTNPLAAAAPGEKGDTFLLDVATTTVSLGKIEMEKRKGNPIKIGWAQGPDGKPTTDADVAIKQGCLMPLGGVDAGYKGYGLAFLVEILSGILSGACYGPNVRKWTNRVAPANLGQCFIAIDLCGFEPGFEERLSDLMKTIRNLQPTDPELPVLVPGDLEKLHMATIDKQGGIRYVQAQLDACKKLAAKHKVKEMTPVKK